MNKRLMTSIAAMTATALLALVLAGCGGSDDGSDSLTKAAFLKQGNALCQEERKEREKVTEAALAEYMKKETPKAKEEAVLTVLRGYEQMTTHLSELGAPEGEEEEVADIIQAMEKGASRAKADPARAFEEFFPFRDANKAVEDYGLSKCTA
jgi:hypothetical protein